MWIGCRAFVPLRHGHTLRQTVVRRDSSCRGCHVQPVLARQNHRLPLPSFLTFLRVAGVVLAKVLENRRLTAADWEQDVRHLALDISGTGLRYDDGVARYWSMVLLTPGDM